MAANIPQTAMMVVEDQPFVERISPFDIFVDPEATCMDDAKWIAQRIVRPLKEARDDRRYRAAARRNLSADSLSYPMYAVSVRQQQEEYLDTEERCVV